MRAALAAKFLVAPPPYIVHSNPALKDGFGDWGFLLKYRIVAANEEHGNYILTAFFQATFPTGQYKNGSSKAIITPTIAYGKGFGRFDIQGTFGATLPTGNEAKIGRTFPGTMLSNITCPRNSGRRSKRITRASKTVPTVGRHKSS